MTGEHLPRGIRAVLPVSVVRDLEADRRAGPRPEGALRVPREPHHPAEVPDVHLDPADPDDLTGVSAAAITDTDRLADLEPGAHEPPSSVLSPPIIITQTT
jgi:hypothetical protein